MAWFPQFLCDVFVGSLPLAALALGFQVAFRGTGVFNVAYGALFVAAGYTFYLVYQLIKLQPLAIFITGLFMCAALIVLDYGFECTGRRLRRANVNADSAILVISVGCALVIEYMCAWIFGSDVLAVSRHEIHKGFDLNPWLLLPLFFALVALSFLTRNRQERWLVTAFWGIISLIFLVVLLFFFSYARNVYVPRGRLLVAVLSLCIIIFTGIVGKCHGGVRFRAYLSSRATARLLAYPTQVYRRLSACVAGFIIGILSAAHVIDVGVRPDEAWTVLTSVVFVGVVSRTISTHFLLMASFLYIALSYLATLWVASNYRDLVATTALLVLLLLGRTRWVSGEGSTEKLLWDT